MSQALKKIRTQIDAIDGQLLMLLNERIKLVLKIGKIKQETGRDIYAPEREQALLRRLTAMNAGPLPADSLRAIYREIMSCAISLEKPVVIAAPGPASGASARAARGKFGKSLRYSLQKNVRAVFETVASRKADYGVVPVEVAGDAAIMDVFDYFMDYPVRVCAQITLPSPKTKISRPEGAVRFFVIGRNSPPPTGHDRTTVLFSLPDKPGVLAQSLTLLAKAGINLIKIESRPSWRAGFKYHFVIELDGHAEDSAMKKGLEPFIRACQAAQIAGSYPV